MRRLLYAAFLFMVACNTNKTPQQGDAKVDGIRIHPIDTLPTHPDDGASYFAMRLLRNDTVQMQIESKRAFVMFGDQNFIIQLDSSAHMLVNGTALNIYINSRGKQPQSYTVVEMSAGRDSATMMLSFKQEEKDMPGFIPTTGIVELTKILNGKYTGNFKATRKDENGDTYSLYGSFQNVGTAE